MQHAWHSYDIEVPEETRSGALIGFVIAGLSGGLMGFFLGVSPVGAWFLRALDWLDGVPS